LGQIGRKQAWSFYEAHGHLALKTLAEYGHAFRLLWELLRRPGEPPWPKSKGSESGLPADEQKSLAAKD
jgi:hypothetical protein